MVVLKLIAPFRALFNLDSSLIAANTDEYMGFLRQLSQALAEGYPRLRNVLPKGMEVQVHLPAGENAPSASRYVSLDRSGSLYLPPCVFTVRFAASEHAQIAHWAEEALQRADAAAGAYSPICSVDIGSFRVGFYDNTIAMLSLDVHIDAKAGEGDQAALDHAWDGIDAWTTSLVQQLLGDLYPHYLYPLLRVVTDVCHQGRMPNFVLDVVQYKLFLDMIGSPTKPYQQMGRRFMLMWVNRTLVTDGSHPVNHWTRAVQRRQGVILLTAAKLHLNWGNNMVWLAHAQSVATLGSLWEDMQAAQYYYASFDAVSANLMKYIGITFARQTSHALRQLNSDMEIVVNSVTVLQVHYRDIGRELQGASRQVFQHLQEEWNFDALVANVQMKIDLYKANLTTLSRETNTRNQWRAEIVLTALAGMSILNLMIGLASYAEQMPFANRKMIGSFPGVMDLGFLVSHNTLAWIGLVLSVAVVMFTVKNRQG